MNLIRANMSFRGTASRAGVALGGLIALMSLTTVRADSASPAPVSAGGTAMSPPAATNGMANRSQSATNAMSTPANPNLAAESTNLLQTNSTNSTVVLDDSYKLTIGDHLSFRIIEDGDEPRPLWVTDSGELEVPYVGRFPAQGKTCRQLAAELKTALEKDYYYQATVIIAVDTMTKSHGRVYLVGAIRMPGPVELPADEVLTLSRAILRAGGFTDYAKRDKVTVTRKDATSKDEKKTFTVDVGRIFDKSQIETDLPLQPDDLIYVPERLWRF
jgi:protein involved in polysaccharide export with SLBB domain